MTLVRYRQPTFEETVVLLEDVRLVFVQYVTLRDLWNLCETYETWLLDAEFAQSCGLHDTMDSFFDICEFDSLRFLRWCQGNEILMRRLVIYVSRSTNSLDLLIALESYLKKFGSQVIAVSFKFTFNCESATSLISLAFRHCPNLIMFSLDGGLLHIPADQCWTILQEARRCHSLYDWVFVGHNPLTTSRATYAYVFFFETLQHLHRFDREITDLFISRRQQTIQACQYTLETLEAVKSNKLFRITFINSDMSDFLHRCFLSMAENLHLTYGISSLRLIMNSKLFFIDDAIAVFPNVCKLSIDWLGNEDEGRWFMYKHCMSDIKILSIWGVQDTHLGRDMYLQLTTFFDMHHIEHGWKPVRLEIHMTDHSSHEELFTFVKDILHVRNAHISTLDLSIESENAGVMSIRSKKRYIPSYEQLIKRTQQLYSFNTVRSAMAKLYSYGRLDRQHILAHHPEFEDIHSLYNIPLNNLNVTEDGILSALDEYTTFNSCFSRLVAGGFENELGHVDTWRIQRVSFEVWL